MSELDEHITLEDFERLYSEYKPRFIIIARSYIRNNMAAEDIVTDSFLYFWENKDKLNITTTIPAYILAYIIHSGFISGYQNRYGDNLKPPTNVYHRMTA